MDPATAASGDACSAGATLSASESRAAIGSLLDGEASEAVAAALPDRPAGQGRDGRRARGGRRGGPRRMIALGEPGRPDRLLDTCGTGGDGAGTVNISTAAAIVVAACGVPVVKHGNRAASGNSGSSDVLTALGVAADPGPDLLARCLAELRIAFLFAPRFHPGLRRSPRSGGSSRSGRSSTWSGPLCNPASPALPARRDAGRGPGRPHGRRSWRGCRTSAARPSSPAATASTR